ncbi:MAG TPA: FAD-dependent oxidoreductase [Candidatus Acidoferrales bacterium]|jgi:ferredoxin-NADP reductase|nr:FAD-dependent oxidoreductase [Candidatus Acidoferrales bacterium]
MPEYIVEFRNKSEVAEGTLAFSLQKPADFNFKAGQTADLTLVDPPETDSEGNTRTFSIASAPWESELMFATRLRDTAFKRNLRNMKPGTKMKLDGPMGSFNLHKNASKPAVFLAGGIGITPFHSIVKEAARQKDPHQIYLFYSNRRPEDTAFFKELEALPQQNPNFHLISTMVEMDKSKQSWSGERGFIDAAMLKRHLPGLAGPIYYAAGPPAMVAAMKEMLVKAGVDEDDVRSEDFPGY